MADFSHPRDQLRDVLLVLHLADRLADHLAGRSSCELFKFLVKFTTRSTLRELPSSKSSVGVKRVSSFLADLLRLDSLEFRLTGHQSLDLSSLVHRLLVDRLRADRLLADRRLADLTLFERPLEEHLLFELFDVLDRFVNDHQFRCGRSDHRQENS